MLRITELSLELMEIEERINGLYAEKKKKQGELKAAKERLLEETRKGKTIDEMERE